MADLDGDGHLAFSEFYSVYACLTIVTEQFKVDDVRQLQPQHVAKALRGAGLNPTQTQIEGMFQLGDRYASKGGTRCPSKPILVLCCLLLDLVAAGRAGRIN